VSFSALKKIQDRRRSFSYIIIHYNNVTAFSYILRATRGIFLNLMHVNRVLSKKTATISREDLKNNTHTAPGEKWSGYAKSGWEVTSVPGFIQKKEWSGLHDTFSDSSFTPSMVYIFSPSTVPEALRVNMNASLDSGVTKNVSLPS